MSFYPKTAAPGGARVTVQEGDWISLNGDTGEVVLGRMALKPPTLVGDYTQEFMQWVDDRRTIKVIDQYYIKHAAPAYVMTDCL